MATTLKNYITANVGTSPLTVYNPTTAGIQSTLIGLVLANTTTSAVTASVTLTSASTTVYIIKNVTLPSGNSLDIIGGSKIIIEQNDSLQVTSSTASSIDVTVSTVEVI